MSKKHSGNNESDEVYVASTKNYAWLRWLLVFLLSVSGITLISARESLRALMAVATSDRILASDLQNDPLEIKRYLQKHFLKYGIYLGRENIFIAPQEEDDDRFNFFMRKTCGQAKIYLWIPLKITLPLKGPVVYSWCWKPQVLDKN